MSDLLQLDGWGRASLDGTWELVPGDHAREDLPGATGTPIEVPGLWEAQGHLDLDGVAWYRRTFSLADLDGCWTLRFGAVMDLADVHLNGVHLGRHELPFTPFELDATAALRQGENLLEVRVVDPALSDPEHLQLPHGKQGWMNHVFPSRPSLYLTYGGIWQPVSLHRHGPVVVRDVFVHPDPADVSVDVELENRTDQAVVAALGLRLLGEAVGLDVEVPARSTEVVTIPIGPTRGAPWTPGSPVLHQALADVRVAGLPSHAKVVRFGLRTIRVEGTRLVLNDEPYRMRSALVQGFTAEELYAEGDRSAIEAEVRAALDMGFNTLRLHIKAFDPTYLDVCDELGMLVHCDLPVAEPIDHEAMGGDTVLVRRCVQAIEEQVRRDRNHPCIILWSAMNELCDGRQEARGWPAYEHFARTLVGAVEGSDPTRPVIENDWIVPDPDRIFTSPIMTAHWYGQLHTDYLRKIDDASRTWSGTGRVFLVSEYGDWGLPQMPELGDPEFWDPREIYAAGLATTRWPASIGRFVQETQRYQGISDRLQTEVWRRHDDIGGYCLTELTDVPQEFNGLLDLHRRPKPLAIAEVARANQPVLPMLRIDTLVAGAGDVITAEVHVANDGPALAGVEVELRFGDTAAPLALNDLLAVPDASLDLDALADRFTETAATVRVPDLPAHRATCVGKVSIVAPEVPGRHDLDVRLWADGAAVAENRYPIHVVDDRPVEAEVRVHGGGTAADALRAVGATVVEDGGTLVIAQDALDAAAGAQAEEALARGEVVVVLAQQLDAGPHYPGSVELREAATAWGSTVFHFTTDHGALPSLPRRNVIVGEDATVHAEVVVSAVGGLAFPDTPAVIAFKPVPGALAGTIVGSTAVGPGRLVLCQYRLTGRTLDGDATARALLADLVRWATQPRPVSSRSARRIGDGRTLSTYTWEDAVAR